MRFLVDIVSATGKKRTHRIEASDEQAALRLLENRLSPADREKYTVDGMCPDPVCGHKTEPFGTFLSDITG